MVPEVLAFNFSVLLILSWNFFLFFVFEQQWVSTSGSGQ